MATQNAHQGNKKGKHKPRRKRGGGGAKKHGSGEGKYLITIIIFTVFSHRRALFYLLSVTPSYCIIKQLCPLGDN